MKIMHAGQIYDPSSGNTIPFRSSQQFICLRLGPLNGLLVLVWRPSSALKLAFMLLLELQRFKDTIRCVELGT